MKIILLSTGIICDIITFRILGNLKIFFKIRNNLKQFAIFKINLTEIIINFKKFYRFLKILKQM